MHVLSSLFTLVAADIDSDSDDSITETPVSAKGKATTSKSSKATNAKSSSSLRDTSNIIYIGHLPRHFQEHELLVLLKQFGNVLHVRLSRSKKTGGSRGYAFCQFAESSVAAIVAGTLSGYLLDGKRLVCHVVAADKIHKHMLYNFGNSNQRNNKVLRKERSLEKVQAISKRLVERQAQRKKKLADMGIDYEFEGYVAPEGSSVSKQTKKRKDSVDSAGSDGKKKRKTSIDSSAEPVSASKTETKKKQRKDSVDSISSETSKGKRKSSMDRSADNDDEPTQSTLASSKSDKKKKMRKDSVDSIASEGSASKKRRKESLDSTGSSSAKESTTPKAKETRAATKTTPKSTAGEAKSTKKQPQSERKTKSTDKKSSSRRKST